MKCHYCNKKLTDMFVFPRVRSKDKLRTKVFDAQKLLKHRSK